MKQNQLWKALGFSVFGVLLLAVPFLVTSSYYMKIISMGAIYLILAAGLNILLGFTGQMSFTQAAFWGIGGYVSAILNTRYHVSFWLALPLSGLFTAGVGFLLGWPSLRKLKKFYLAVTTIGFVQITGIVLTNWTEVTNGADGISGIVRPVIGTLFTKEQFMYYVIMTGVVVLVGFTALLKNSRVGRAMLAIREDDLAAEVIGVDTFKYKVLAFTLSAFYGGIAGSLFAHLIGFISPDTYTFEEAVTVLCMLLIGGSGTIWGPVVGAVLLSIVPEWLRFLKDYTAIIYGAVVVIMAVFMPMGIVGKLESLREHRAVEVGKPDGHSAAAAGK